MHVYVCVYIYIYTHMYVYIHVQTSNATDAVSWLYANLNDITNSNNTNICKSNLILITVNSNNVNNNHDTKWSYHNSNVTYILNG